MSETDSSDSEVIRISPAEVMAARVEARPWTPAAQTAAMPFPPAATRRPSRLAVGSLVMAVLGVPLVGCLLGPIAIVLGALALAGLMRESKGGFRLAVAGISLGLLEFVGWGVALWIFLGERSPVRHAGFTPPFPSSVAPLGTEQAPAHILRALSANVRVVCGQRQALLQGSGVAVARNTEGLWVLTNRHVARCAEGRDGWLRVGAAGRGEKPAQIRWLAPHEVDLALLASADLVGVAIMPLAPRRAKVGDPVFAVGNPIGLEATYTVGTVSALRTARFGRREVGILQVQTSIGPGSSGGGLYTAEGVLLGINTWIADQRLTDGIGFAISIDDGIELMRTGGAPWRPQEGSQP